MWIVHYKPNKDSQPWSTIGIYDNKRGAVTYASRVSDVCFLVIVTAPDGSVIWAS